MKKSSLIYPLLAFSITSTQVLATPIFKYFNENGEPKAQSLDPTTEQDKSAPLLPEDIPTLTLIAKPDSQTKPGKNNLGLFITPKGATYVLSCKDLERGITLALIAKTKSQSEKTNLAIDGFIQNLNEGQNNIKCPRMEI